MALPSAKKERHKASLFPLSRSASLSVEAEVYFNIDLHCDRLAIFHRRLEFPIAHRLNRLLIQSHTQRASDLDIAGLAVGTDDQPQYAGSLILRLASLFGVLGVGRIQG